MHTDRKKSNDSEKSTSDFSAIMSDSRSQTKDVLSLQKKMKVLRDAVIKERQDKENATKLKNEFAVEVDKLRVQMSEKDALILKLKAENVELRDKYQVERKKTENASQNGQQSDSSFGISDKLGLSSFFTKKATPDEYQKLQTEHNYLKKQLEVMLERLNKSEGNIEQVKRENRQQTEGVQKKLIERERELEDKVQAYIALSHKHEDLINQNQNLSKDKTRIEKELARLRKDLEAAVQERDELEKNNTEKMRMMNEMNEVCQRMEGEIQNLSQKLKYAMNELEETESKLQVFNVKRVGKMLNTDAQILLRRNVAGEYVIEIENAGEQMLIYPQSIQSFGPLKETEDRFYLEFKTTRGTIQKDLFVAEDRAKVLKQLKTLVKLSDENQNAINGKKNTTTEKNLLAQVVSFFGN